MNFFNNITNTLKRKAEELKDKKDFLDLVEREAKPIRRAAYLNQRKIDAIEEGKAKARIDRKAMQPRQQKNRDDFGIKPIEDPYKFLGGNKTKSRNKKNGN